MDLPALIAALSDPGAYPVRPAAVEVCQTHISVVFLADQWAYKIKKPVTLPFLDFSTPGLRRQFCEAEVRLNRRLAGDVYQGVVPVTWDGRRLTLEGNGAPVDWAVKMRRLPETATLEHRVLTDGIRAQDVRSLAARLVHFHATAARSPEIAAFGRFEAVARNIRENFTVSEPLVGLVIAPAVRRRLLDLTESALASLEGCINARAARGVPCDTHGDLHLDHVYLFPEQHQPDDLVIVDCIEFNERFRYTDPVADMAFLAMDFEFHGRHDLAAEFTSTYFSQSGDSEGWRLLPLYVSYRAAVRGKVDGLQYLESEIPPAARDRALQRARGHWLLSLNALEQPAKRAAVVLVGGLPGTGKSTLAARLAAQADFSVIRSDVVRKELAGLDPQAARAAPAGEGLYSPAMTERTYAEGLSRCEQQLFEGGRVIVDATFIDAARRRAFLELALRSGIQPLLLWCTADEATIRDRLAARQGDASDADWEVYQHAARRCEPPQGAELRWTRALSSGDPESACREALTILANL